MLACFVVLALAMPEAAKAQSVQTLVSNFARIQATTRVNLNSTDIRAQGFTTGANPAGYGLTSIKVDFRQVVTAPTSFTASIWTTNAQGDPQARDEDIVLTNPADISTTGSKTFTASLGARLNASSTYALVLTSDGLVRLRGSELLW